MYHLSPLLVRHTDCGHIFDLGMCSNDLLHFGGIDILSATDDHVALAVGKVIIAVLVSPGHVADGAIPASERISRLFWQLPVALKRVRCARIEFADFAVADLLTVRIKELNPPATKAFAAYGTELGQLLLGTQQSYPARFRGAVSLIELRSSEIFHQRQLSILTSRRRGDKELSDTVYIELALDGFGQSQNHDVVRWHQ